MKEKRKMSPIIHNSPEFKGLRKAFEGINATTKGSIEKSKRRHELKKRIARRMSMRRKMAMWKRDGVFDKNREEIDSRDWKHPDQEAWERRNAGKRFLDLD